MAFVVSIPPDRYFSPGQTCMTVGVAELLQEGRLDPATLVTCLGRHLCGDWGDLDDHDRRRNDTALKSGKERLFSVYQVTPSLNLWIITEWDRSVTTLLLPSEY